MEENEQPDDFDDFFDTPARPADNSAPPVVKSDRNRDSKSTKDSKVTTDQSAKKHNRNNSASSSVDKSSVSSEHDDSDDYSSDSVTDSDSDTDSRSRKRKNERSRSRSASSRSGGSVSSESSYSSGSRESQSRSSRKNGRRSRSRSESTDSSTSRTATPDSTAQKRKTQAKNKRRDSYSSVTSSSTYLGGKERRKRTPSPVPASRRQAWSTAESSASRRQDRPKTAKRRSSDDKPARQAESHRRERNGKSYADTDSDMTDVSPIASPRNGSVNGHRKEMSDKGFSSKPPVFQAMPLGVEDSGNPNSQEPGNNAIDLNILMKAVSELEKQKRVKSNTRRVMFEPLRARPMEKSNFTFSNDDTHRIEQENKRLLRQIMRQVHSTGEKRHPAKDLKVQQSTLTPSAINRRREQQRIENENLAFLKRLQKVKPSRGLSRSEQLTAYNSTVLHGIPIATLHPTGSGPRSGRQSSASSIAGSLGRTRSMTSIHSTATASSFTSRQSSRAGSRPTSAKKSGRERPPWNDRW
ncbi:uncharacterized protein LOC143283704 [Babylonia areolata]|uniref:uncharacterized protein LOC143283704 n=1 Tax=Babylonia areolata TaxID=304850 RepID=UPI003FD0D3C3